ncbi:MAG: iron-containing alcohol dehydrogenase [Lachnospiraceae bacterium]
MRKIVLGGKQIITGAGSLSYLEELAFHKVLVVTGGKSMIETGVIDRAVSYLKSESCEVRVHAGVLKNPSIEQVTEGLHVMREFAPEAVIAIGGGSAMDCAKAMLLFYEFPQLNFDNVLRYNQEGRIPADRKTALICIPSTSGTGSEVTRGTVITDTAKELKVPIMTDCLRPDLAILDAELAMTMPRRIAAETGMDALTHAIEAYTNHNLDDFDEGLCKSAIEGIMKWLLISYEEGTLEAREKIHHYQAMAGIGFANVGLGMVHGIAHSYGAVFDMAHGLTNAIILPYVLTYNRRNETVREKLEKLSYHCRCEDIVEEIKKLNENMMIPDCFLKAGITEEQFGEKYQILLDHAMIGATNVNPVKMERSAMEKMLQATFYGKEIDF